MPLEKVPVCLIVPDAEGIVGNANPKNLANGGKRYRVACGSKSVPKHRTDLVAVTTCPKCLKSADFKAAFKEQDIDGYMRAYPEEFAEETAAENPS